MSFTVEEKYKTIINCWPKTSQVSWMSPEYKENWVTVIITTFQRADYIIQTANSILNQTYRPIELIIIDDGSEDATRDILQKWEKRLPEKIDFEFHYIYQKNTGAPAARNLALLLSKGEFIQEVGSDDLLHPKKLELHISALKNNLDCQSAWSPLLRFHNSEEKELYSSSFDSNEITVKKDMTQFLFEPQFLPSAGLHRRHVFYLAGPWLETLKRWQDLEYQVRMALCIKKYIEINVPLYFFRQHNGVRINSQYKQKAGLESGFLALGAIVQTLENLNYRNKYVNLEISKFYFSLAELAANHSLRKQMNKAISGTLRNRKDVGFYFRIRIYQLIANILGGKFANRLAKLYFKPRNSKLIS